MARSKVIGEITSWITKILFLIIAIILINFLSLVIDNSALNKIAYFINSNLILFVVISILFFISDVIHSLGFPINLASPPFDAFGSVFVANFLIKLFGLLDSFATTGISNFAIKYESLIYVIVFLLVLLTSYLSIFSKVSKHVKHYRNNNHEKEEVEEQEPHKKPIRRKVKKS